MMPVIPPAPRYSTTSAGTPGDVPWRAVDLDRLISDHALPLPVTCGPQNGRPSQVDKPEARPSILYELVP